MFVALLPVDRLSRLQKKVGKKKKKECLIFSRDRHSK